MLRLEACRGSSFLLVLMDGRAFADYVLGSLILHFFCINFIN